LSRQATWRALLTVLWPVRRLVTLLLAVAVLAVLFVLAHFERRRPRRTVPRIFWGVNPRISIPAHSEALRRLAYPISSEPAAGRPPRLLPRSLAAYWTFAWALRGFDLFAFSTDSTILHGTPLKYRELQLLRIGRKKVLLLADGVDVRIPSRAHNLLFKHALSLDCPSYARAERGRLRDLEYSLQYADHIVSGADWVDYMPWWDRLTAGYFAVDVEQWKPEPRSRPEPGSPLVVLHVTSHRELEGTQFLVRACEELAGEGVPIELRVVERHGDETLRALMQEADIVADQFVIGWYGRLALEGMSLAKPVLSYLRSDLLELYTLFSFAGECPVVDTAPFEIKEKLRELASDPERRSELGRRGRQYARDHHSIEALALTFDEIFTALWPPPESP
jgi:glycosyltransferase involved in cell wall biosynthesis